MPTPSINFSPGTVVTSTWLNTIDAHEFDYVANVKDFGAVGDGVTDDLASIQAAFDSIDPNVGGVVDFPPGRYIVGGTIIISRNNTTVRGTRGAVIKQKDNMPVPGWPPIVDGRGSIIAAFQKLNISILNLTFDGNKANNDINDNYGNGINIYDCQRVLIQGNHVFGCARDGITISDYTRLDALALGNEDIIIVDNLVTDCGSVSQTTGGEGIIVVQGNKVVVANNICNGNKYRGIEIETLATTGTYRGLFNVTVTGNICFDNDYANIGINGASQLTVTGNISIGSQYGIRVNNITSIITSQVIINGNKINAATVNGILVQNYEELQVLNNNVEGCTIGILLTGVKDITIQNNMISGSLQHGIQFTSGTNQNVILTGNLVRASGQTAANTYDNVTGNATYCVITGNRIDGTSARYGINAAGSSWTILGNALDNSGATGLVNDTTGNARIRDNGGYITEANGTATINSGTTSVVVTHGCSKTPTLANISVTLGENPTNTAGDIWVSTITSTQFTINCRNNPGASNLDVGWRVQIL